jgi:hypothetical protein
VISIAAPPLIARQHDPPGYCQQPQALQMPISDEKMQQMQALTEKHRFVLWVT